MTEWDKYLDGLEARVGTTGGKESVFRYMEMTEHQMRSMTADECGEAAAVLAALAFKVQRQRNVFAARAMWCEQKLRKDLAPAMRSVSAYSFDERRGIALAGNEEAGRLDRERVGAEGAALRLDFLPQRLELLVRTFLALQETKRKSRG